VASFDVEIEIQRANLEGTSPGMPYERQKTKVDDLAGIKNKLEQNARRARLDLDRRRDDETRQSNRANIRFAALIGVAGGIVGAIIGRW
jgi:hypothetical protein